MKYLITFFIFSSGLVTAKEDIISKENWDKHSQILKIRKLIKENDKGEKKISGDLPIDNCQLFN